MRRRRLDPLRSFSSQTEQRSVSLSFYTQETSNLIKGESQEVRGERERKKGNSKREWEGGSRKREEKLMSNKRGEWLFIPFSLSSPCPSHIFFSGQEKKGPVIIIITIIYFSYRHSWMKLSFFLFSSSLLLSFSLSLPFLLLFQLIQENFPESQDCLKMKRRGGGEWFSFPWEWDSETGIFVPKLGHEPSVTGWRVSEWEVCFRGR